VTGGIRALAAFFLFGATASGISFITLAFPGGPLDTLWRVNPRGHVALRNAGAGAIVLMAVVCGVCALTAWGLWRRARWGYRLAVAMLALNLLGDTMNAFVLGDRRTLIGLPVGALLIAYLLSPRVRATFHPHATPRGAAPPSARRG
jgi:hypothetical protein